jgi:hypothetical protein
MSVRRHIIYAEPLPLTPVSLRCGEAAVVAGG